MRSSPPLASNCSKRCKSGVGQDDGGVFSMEYQALRHLSDDGSPLAIAGNVTPSIGDSRPNFNHRERTGSSLPPRQLIVAPPSITMVWPVVKEPALEARNTASPAISSGSTIRNSGERAVEAFSVSGLSHSALAKSVLIRPGAMQLTRTLCGPYSQARLRASCMSAALEIA